MSFNLFRIGALILFFIFVPTLVQAEETKKEPTVSLLCTPGIVGEKRVDTEAVLLTAGQGTTFTCSTASLDKKERRILLIGKETYEKDLPGATVTEVTLSAEPVFSTLTFPAAYRTGAYGYAFSVIDLDTKEEVATPNLFQGILKGDVRASIKDMGVDKERYQWQDPVLLHLALMIPEGMKIENEKLSLHIAVQNQQGEECVVLEEYQEVTEEEADFTFVLPGEEQACVNALSIVLKQDGAVIDQKILAFGVESLDTNKNTGTTSSGESMWSSIPKILLIGIGLTAVLCLALAGYFLLRRERVRKF